MYNRRLRRKNCCMNNNQADKCEKESLEEACQKEYCNCQEYYDDCECGYDEEQDVFPDNPKLGQSYVPIQQMDRTFIPNIGLKMGTIYPELVSPYCPGQSMKEIEYLRNATDIGEGCNVCRKKIEE